MTLNKLFLSSQTLISLQLRWCQKMLYFLNARILTTKRATIFGLHSIYWKLNEVSYSFFPPLGSAILLSEVTSVIFGLPYYNQPKIFLMQKPLNDIKIVNIICCNTEYRNDFDKFINC